MGGPSAPLSSMIVTPCSGVSTEAAGFEAETTVGVCGIATTGGGALATGTDAAAGTEAEATLEIMEVVGAGGGAMMAGRGAG